MPNWCEGTLKVRGNLENVKKFLLEGLNVYKFTDEREYVPVPKSEWLIITDNKDYGYYEIEFNDDDVYVEQTNRAFVDIDNGSPALYWEQGRNERNVVSVMHVRQAWGFREKEWCEISKQYGVDIKLYGIEQGMMFTENIEIIAGEVTRNESHQYKTYEEWLWECPFPHMGG